MVHLDLGLMNELSGKMIIVKFPAREVSGELKKRTLKNEYFFHYNETPGNPNGASSYGPIFPSNQIPKNARNFFLMINIGQGRYLFENITV